MDFGGVDKDDPEPIFLFTTDGMSGLCSSLKKIGRKNTNHYRQCPETPGTFVCSEIH